MVFLLVVLDVSVRRETICNCLVRISIERTTSKDNLLMLVLHKWCTTGYLPVLS